MVAVIGDVHGCYYTLIELYNKIRRSYSSIPILCVGDLVDRGNHSFEVIQFFIDEKIRFTPGNHDYMFLHFFKEPSSVFAKSWIFNGNEATLESYEPHEDSLFKHIDYISKQPLFYDLPDGFISHAGLSVEYLRGYKDSRESFFNQIGLLIHSDFRTDRGVLWTRDPLLNIGRLQVVGHTKQKEVTLDEDSNAVYIDTGACVGNKLSAIIIHENEIIDTIDEKTHLNDII